MAFPTDTRLCQQARAALVAEAKAHGVKLRQSYVRKGKEAHYRGNKYMSARKYKQGRKQIRHVRDHLGRVIRDIEPAVDRDPSLQAVFDGKLAAAIYYILIKLRLMRLVRLPRYACAPAF